MMSSFLRQVADHYYALGPGELEKMCFIFPNRRSMAFWRKSLADAVAEDPLSQPIVVPRLYTINDFVHMMDNSEGVVQSSNMVLSFADVFPVGMMRTSLYMGIIQWAAIFMLGNMLFKKHKTGKTLVCYMGISYVLSTIFGLAFLTNGRLERWLESLEDVAESEMIQIAHNGMIWGTIIGIVVTAVLLYFTYRKIKTQKY